MFHFRAGEVKKSLFKKNDPKCELKFSKKKFSEK